MLDFFLTLLFHPWVCPQLFMCLVWLLLQIVVAMMYYDLQPGAPTRPSQVGSSQNVQEEEEEPLMQHEVGKEEATDSGNYGSTLTENQNLALGDECRYVPNGHLADEELAKEREKNPFHNFISMRGEEDFLWQGYQWWWRGRVKDAPLI